MRRLLIPAVLLTLAGCDVLGGEMIVKGTGNVIADNPTADRLAAHLASFGTTPRVSDEELRVLYDTIRQRALEGDMEASLVVLRVAAIQRQPVEDSDE